MNTSNQFYPSAHEIDAWVEELFSLSSENPVDAEIIDPELFEWPELDNLPYQYAARHHEGAAYVRFTPNSTSDDPFFAFWQPSLNQPAPLLIHVPGYGAEMCVHPELVAEGYNVLHVNPLGFCTPEGMNRKKITDPSDPLSWPQLPETITSYGERGYRQWFVDCIRTVAWGLKQPEVLRDRFSFFGTSQGGGAALILASLFKDRGVRCVAADVPFLTDYPLADGRGAYEIVAKGLKAADDKEKAWHALGYVDTMSHVHRFSLPVLLTAGEMDEMCPPETITSLYHKLTCTRSFSFIKGREHRYTPEFLYLCRAWFGMYA